MENPLRKDVRFMNLANQMIAGQAFATFDETTTLGEKALVGLQVVAIGMGVVFGVLILLIGILQIFKLFAVKKPKEAPQQAAPAPAAAPAPVTAPPVTVSANASDEAQIVAIATAAIAAARGESECAFNVISIKKIVK